MRNDSSGAIIEVEGDETDLDAFLTRLRATPPPLAVIETVEDQDIPLVGGTGFAIADTSRSDGGRTLASPDVAMCADCAAELRDPADRRYRHAVRQLHQLRSRASRSSPRCPTTAPPPRWPRFPMCADCAREYADPADRRFHAQPVCCPNCGPTLRYRTATAASPTARTALRRARRLLRDGGILAVKGIGGYHLACDAGNERGRRRAAPPQAPRRQAVRGDGARPGTAHAPSPTSTTHRRACLSGPQRPIVLLAAQAGRTGRRRRSRHTTPTSA